MADAAITIVENPDTAEWDRYVLAHPQSRFCHLSAYACLQSTYGYSPRYFAFRKGGKVVGGLPAFQMRSLFFGSRLVSQPFSEYGGLLLDDGLDEGDRHVIFGELRALTLAQGVPSLEMHGACGIEGADPQRYLVKDNAQHCAYLILDRPFDELWGMVFDRSVRKAVNKATRLGLTVVEECDAPIILNRFYPLYLRSMARLGVPPHTVRYFLDCFASFGSRMKIFWAVKDGEYVAGLLGFTCGRRVNITNTVSDPEHWPLNPNDLVHCEFIKWAQANGFKYFDFGSVRYDGQLMYKRKWGCTIDEHGYYFLSPEAGRSKVTTFNSSSPKMALMSKVWGRYTPAPVAERLGPFLRKHLVR